MLAEAHPYVRRLLRFIALPYCFLFDVNWNECKRAKILVAYDLLYIFFKFKYYPDNYSICRLYEKSKKDWIYYYGSSYDAYSRVRLRKEVQPYDYQILFNDKAVTEKLCRGMNIRMPDYFGSFSPKDNYKVVIEEIFRNEPDIKLIIKPNMGRGGQGIDLLYKENHELLAKSEERVMSLNDYKITEPVVIQRVVTQDKRISAIGSSSVNTIRIITLLKKNREVLIVAASMRFGVGGSYVDNWSAGGVEPGIDISTGRLMEVAYDNKGVERREHPDSKIVFKDREIPFWEEVVNMAVKVQLACPFYKLIGLDVAITPEGPTLIEANANPDIPGQEQMSGPFLKNNAVLTAFNEYDLLVNRHQKRLLSKS